MNTNVNPAQILGRITVRGRLHLAAPLLIGEGESGEERNDRDIHVLRSKDGVPFIPGTSLAGALRSLIEVENPCAADILFGTMHRTGGESVRDERQSAVSLYDVELNDAVIGSRDGVHIDDVTGTAIDAHKYDYEIVESGAGGTFYAEILLRRVHQKDEHTLKETLLRLSELLRGGFHVGALTTKGFGRMQLRDMVVDCYDFRRPEDTIAWLSPKRGNAAWHMAYDDAAQTEPPPADGDFVITADFALTGALIVRDSVDPLAETDGEKSPVARMKTNAAGQNIIPGTSLKGVLRHRAAYILHALGKEPTQAEAFIDHLMGTTAARGRFIVEEAVVDAEMHTQTRSRIDRFTGGTIPSALFSTAPVWREKDGGRSVTLRFGVRQASEQEAGLCVLLLKDLWLGRAAIGGEKSIGRGTLEGLHAVIRYHGRCYELTQGQNFAADTVQTLQGYVTALCEEDAT